MPDENPAPNAEPAAAATTTEQPGNPPAERKSFTQEDVDRIVANRLSQERQRHSQQPAPATRSEDPAEPKKSPMTVAKLQRQMDFNDHAAELGMSREARRVAFDLYEAQGAPELGQWLQSNGKWFQQGQQQNTAAPAAAAVAPTEEPAKPPAAAPRAPGPIDMPVDTGGYTDIYRTAAEKLAQLPPGKLRELHERNLSIANSQSGAPPVPRMGLQQKR